MGTAYGNVWPRRRLVVSLGLLAAGGPAVAQPAEGVRVWDFAVSLDGDPIGTHRFEVRQSGSSLTMRGEAAFAVKIFGLTVYRYRHVVTSRWVGDCLASLSAQTDDDGVMASVVAEGVGDGVRVVRRQGGGGEVEQSVAGCLMDFAYWNPRMLGQTRLLNPQTGEVEPVRIVAGREGEVVARGAGVSARSWRIIGTHEPIEVWYSGQGAWVGLDAAVKGRRTLSYRLQ